MNRSVGIILAGALALGAAVPQQAAAQDLGIALGARLGSLDLNNLPGLGGGAAPVALGGVEVTYWLNDDIALDFGGYMGSIAADGGQARFDLGLWGGVLLALAQADMTKFELGLRLGAAAVVNRTFADDFSDDDGYILGEVLFRIEHWFDNHFTIAGLVGLSVAGDPDDSVGFAMALGAQAGLTVTYYFDGTGAPGDGTPAPVTSGGGGYGGGGGGGGGGGAGAGGGGADTGGGEAPPPDPESGAAGW